MKTREQMVIQRNRSIPTKWYDLVTFDKEWIKDKVITMYEDSDGVIKPMVRDSNGTIVYPK